jgi:lipid II:glycine glycyltransferase (peptidoglycan interpeptide bridge formation enzyme)
MQSSFWGRFRRGLGWTPFRIAVPGAGAQPMAVAQVLVRRIPYTPYTLGFVWRGPLLDYADEQALVAMLRALDGLAAHVHAVSITCELPEVADPLLGARLQRLGLRPAKLLQHGATRVLDISPPPEQIQAGWKPKWRYNTRLAVRHGVTVREADTVEDLARWYALLRVTSARDKFTTRSEEYYRRFWQMGRKDGATALLLAEYEGMLLSGMIVHLFGDEATYVYGASSNEHRNVMAPQLLQWEAMQWARARGATRYDLFGIAATDDEHDPLAGVSRLKAGYGGRVVHYAGAYERVYHRVLAGVVHRALADRLG